MARASNGKRVWILGAGFSKALGGPLITDLLAMREPSVLKSLFPASEYPDSADEQFKVRVFYKYGHERGYWDHAEQFLDLVESAIDELSWFDFGTEAKSHGTTLLESMLKDTVRFPATQMIEQGGSGPYLRTVEVPGPALNFDNVGDFARACRRALAVDCSIFLRSAQLNSERWQPYKDWARSLTNLDTVITFNYDHVPELLAIGHNSALRVIDPVNTKDDLADARNENAPVVLKVHGSVTWAPDGDGVNVIDVEDPSVGSPRLDFLIGVPGPRKREVYRKSLQHLRNAARDAISEAVRIVFVGYRFPPTDADARRDILGAIRSLHNQFATEIETVLGPRVDGADSARLLHMLRSVTKATVTAVPLFAEDYFSLLGVNEGL